MKYASYFGGKSGTDFVSQALLHNNSLYLVGNTGSSDFPITENALDKSFDGKTEMFLSKQSNNGKELLYSSFVGGSETTYEGSNSVVVSKKGDVYLSGSTDGTLRLPAMLSSQN